MDKRTALLWLIGLLLLAGLACSQAGEILSPEEATAQAEESSSVRSSSGGTGEQIETSGPQIGEEVTLDSTSFLVNLQREPGGRVVAGQERGATATILDIASHEGELWYQIDASTGDGWVREENIVAIEAPEEAEEVSGPQPGDTVYLTGVGFIVNLLREPGGLIVAGQERGTPVTIIEVANENGETWYLIDAPTGEGWVPAENITTEAP